LRPAIGDVAAAAIAAPGERLGIRCRPKVSRPRRKQWAKHLFRAWQVANVGTP